MTAKTPIILAIAIILAAPISVGAKKKNQPNRGMLEKMDAVPCGAKQKGLAGLGSFWASLGITDVHSTEKLCPEYLIRTDDADYRVRPRDMKHPVVLPVGQEVVFKLKKDRMMIKVPEGDQKLRSYEVVGIEQTDKPAEHVSSRANRQ